MADLMRIIEALPLSKQFVVLDDTGGFMSGLLWRLHAQQRLAGALVLNVNLFFADDFPDTEMYMKFKGLCDTWVGAFNRRDVEMFRSNVNGMTLQCGKKMMKANTARWEEDLQKATEMYW